MEKKRIAIDFDHTICNSSYPECGEPIKDAIETIKELYEREHTLILWTLREKEVLETAKEWLKEHGILHCFSYINENIKEDVEYWNYNPRKLSVDYFIDDRNIGWELLGWSYVRKFFLGE